jgi:ABC-type phosphate transport system permease subunit
MNPGTALSAGRSRSPQERLIDRWFVRTTLGLAVLTGVLLAFIVLVIAWRSLPALQQFGLGYGFGLESGAGSGGFWGIPHAVWNVDQR